MRTKGVGNTEGTGRTGRKALWGALGALVVYGAIHGCTVGPTADTQGGNSPIRITVPTTTAPATTATPSTTTDPTPTTTSTPTPADAKGSPARVLWSAGDSGTAVRELQARLRQVAWLAGEPTGSYDGETADAVRGFQAKRGLPRTGATDSVTWGRLVAMTHEPTKWELYAYGGQPAAAPDPRCLTGRVLCISKTSRTLRWMVDGRTLSVMDVRFGSQYTPTREGVFHVYWKSRDHYSTLYDAPMPYAMFFSGGQAVHFSYDFAANGYTGGSHGCVNVRDETKIVALFDQVRVGDKVVVYW
ncbi:ErfK/YbiS/YcfS/YnhG family protein [Actinobacteria bacterium OK074]|nr:ErfK/YbiS/YcfS/YnhG family protein [Actinobacteria bacterium OK074]